MSLCGRVESASVAMLARNCKHLQRLYLTGCTQMTDEAVVAIGRGCSKLQQLYVIGCVQITDAAFVAIADGCPQLQEIYAFHCNRVTDVGISALAHSCAQLRELGVAYTQTTDVGCQAVADGLPLLTAIFVSWCPEVTDTGVQALAARLPKLHFIGLQATAITDDSLDSLVGGAARGALRTIYVRECAGIAPQSVARVRATLPHCVVLA